MKHLFILIFLLNINAFASNLGETNKAPIGQKELLEKVLFQNYLEMNKQYDKIMENYDKMAKGYNNSKTKDAVPALTAKLLKIYNIKKMPRFIKHNEGYLHTIGKNKIFTSAILHSQRKILVNGKEITLYGENNKEVLKNVVKQIRKMSDIKTSFLNFILSSSYADEDDDLMEFLYDKKPKRKKVKKPAQSDKNKDYRFGYRSEKERKEVAMFMAVFSVFEYAVKADDFNTNAVCKNPKTDFMVTLCARTPLFSYTKRLMKSCVNNLEKKKRLYTKLSGAAMASTYKKNPYNDLDRPFISNLEYLYLKEKRNPYSDIINHIYKTYDKIYFTNKSNSKKILAAKKFLKKQTKLYLNMLPAGKKHNYAHSCNDFAEVFNKTYDKEFIIYKKEKNITDPKKTKKLINRNTKLKNSITKFCQDFKVQYQCIIDTNNEEQKLEKIFSKARKEDKDIWDHKRIQKYYNDRHPIKRISDEI